jgi:hypothetical protein
MMADEEIILVSTVHGQLEAEILKSLLESEGIHVLLSQEGAGAVLGMTVGPMGAVDLLVRASQVAAANALLKAYASGELDDESAGNDLEPGPPP